MGLVADGLQPPCPQPLSNPEGPCVPPSWPRRSGTHGLVCPLPAASPLKVSAPWPQGPGLCGAQLILSFLRRTWQVTDTQQIRFEGGNALDKGAGADFRGVRLLMRWERLCPGAEGGKQEMGRNFLPLSLLLLIIINKLNTVLLLYLMSAWEFI